MFNNVMVRKQTQLVLCVVFITIPGWTLLSILMLLVHLRLVCLINDQSAFSMDTGLIDSHLDLGINARPANRIKFRHVTTCAPLHGKNWISIENATSFGPVVSINAGSLAGNNWTFQHKIRFFYDNKAYTLRLDLSISDR
jgi:hypothetical protein